MNEQRRHSNHREEPPQDNEEVIDHSVHRDDAVPDAFPEPVLGPPYDPDPERERVRGWLALFFATLLGLITCVPIVLVASEATSVEEMEGILGLVLGPVVGIVGTVLGFYFGSQTKGPR